jgi:hypothetical protein
LLRSRLSDKAAPDTEIRVVFDRTVRFDGLVNLFPGAFNTEVESASQFTGNLFDSWRLTVSDEAGTLISGETYHRPTPSSLAILYVFVRLVVRSLCMAVTNR